MGYSAGTMKLWHKALLLLFFVGLWSLGNTIALSFMAGIAVGIIFMIACQIKEDKARLTGQAQRQ